MSVRESAVKAARIAFDKKATDVVILDMRGLTSLTDYFIICTAEADAHTKAIVDEIEMKMLPEEKPWHIEGYQHLKWVLMDYVDFVVHVFTRETRDYYNIERLWADAPVEKIESSDE
ncbi:MAG: ribosome silencing factor [Candidatus Marinimicrobia bacterium CG08_land_8_20_14_0_20_45_22]|nr:MAG: ribosome silencing factor [Candidatus Marinimicrobia bacterium CG08_land_8_20_14_0_20_45_22]